MVFSRYWAFATLILEIPLFEAFEKLEKQVAELSLRLAKIEAQQLTGLSQATLARERKKPGTLPVWKSTGAPLLAQQLTHLQ